jgi:hypothetical protein
LEPTPRSDERKIDKFPPFSVVTPGNYATKLQLNSLLKSRHKALFDKMLRQSLGIVFHVFLAFLASDGIDNAFHPLVGVLVTEFLRFRVAKILCEKKHDFIGKALTSTT